MEIITKEQAIAQGLRTFFTGQPCKRGHVCPRSVSMSCCQECNREAQRRFRARKKQREARVGAKAERLEGVGTLEQVRKMVGKCSEDRTAMRRCLSCRKEFKSEGFHERICPPCKMSQKVLGYEHESTLPTKY